MDKIYRLYTEDIDRESIMQTVSKYFHGFNVQEAEGYYKGNRELALVIELVAPAHMSHVMRFIAKVIAQVNGQDCVLVTEHSVKGEFVNGL